MREDAREALNFANNLWDGAPIRPLSVKMVKEPIIRKTGMGGVDSSGEGCSCFAAIFRKWSSHVLQTMHCQQPSIRHRADGCQRPKPQLLSFSVGYLDASNAFLGSTPERLWRRRGTLLRTGSAGGHRRQYILTISRAQRRAADERR